MLTKTQMLPRILGRNASMETCQVFPVVSLEVDFHELSILRCLAQFPP